MKDLDAMETSLDYDGGKGYGNDPDRKYMYFGGKIIRIG